MTPMSGPDQPDTNNSTPTAVAEDSDILLSGETATTGTDEAETGDAIEASAGDEPDRVNLSTPDATAYWARHFQVTAEQIHEAVEAVGSKPQRVAAHLGKRWPYEGSGIV